jgi:D-glycero-D-manno-heptose 1,7-bisphosphate phosphatase
MRPALFLDRDGVINRKGGSYYITTREEFIVNEGIEKAISHFRSKGFLIIVITNQGCVAKGVCTEEQLVSLHSHMNRLLAEYGAAPDAVYYCPHHPDISECNCRKPGNALFEKAITEFNIDRERSVMIGDTEADCIAAKRSGIKCHIVEVNANLYNWLTENNQL